MTLMAPPVLLTELYEKLLLDIVELVNGLINPTAPP